MTSYEWVYETVDEHGDIIDVEHSDKMDELPSTGRDVGLVRDSNGDRAWAYIENGRLPDVMRDDIGNVVCLTPDKYRKQFERFAATC